jgi:hypothetical protein
MTFCNEHGIPHSKFRKWDPEDRDKVLAYMEFHGRVCQRCGTRPEEWLDEDGKLIEPLPYSPVSTKCHGCVTLEEARAKVDKDQVQVTTHSLKKLPRKLAERIHRKWQIQSPSA